MMCDVAERVRDLTSRVAFDVIQVEFPFLTPYLKAVAPHHRAKKILSMHNIESLRFEREIQLSQWGKRRLVLLGDHYFLSRLGEESPPAVRRHYYSFGPGANMGSAPCAPSNRAARS